MKSSTGAAGVAWLVAALFYFYQYALRSAPAVMMPQLSAAFQVSGVGLASLLGLFYYGYSPFSLVAGAAMDRIGPKAVIPTGALMAGVGALLFGTGNLAVANLGRFLQGAGGVFALVGAVYIAANNFPASSAATLIGATQMFGMAGGSAGQFLVGPIVARGVRWNVFWVAMGVVGLLMASLLVVLLPKQETKNQRDDWIKGAMTALGAVFRNPQSILCGLIAGLLFMPTSIFGMVWGVRFLQEAHGFDYGSAVIRSATVPLGWIIGSPLLGLLSDRVGRRKPVIAGGGCVLLGCITWILYGPAAVFPPYILGLVTGAASGAAMLPYTVIKEANLPQFSGTATGVINFLNFTLTALLGPLFGRALYNASAGGQIRLEHYQTAFQALLYGVALAVVLTFVLKETGPALRVTLAAAEGV
jgi:MFS family permease